MSSLKIESADLLGIGPTVVVIDDIDREVVSLTQELRKRNAGVQYLNANKSSAKFPDRPFPTVQLVFLDLHYDVSYGARFDAYLSAEWLTRVVPHGHHYALVLWTKDDEHKDELLEVMAANSMTMPYFVEAKKKELYRTGDATYNVVKLLDEIYYKVQHSLAVEIQEIPGQIVAVEDNHVLVNCLLHDDPQTFEVRRLDILPFRNYIQPVIGNFLSIKVVTKPGSKTFEYTELNSDLSDRFKKIDDFENLGDLSFLYSDPS